MAEIGYCVKCRKKVEMQETKEIQTKNKKRAMMGTCPICKIKVFRFLKTTAGKTTGTKQKKA